MNFSKYIFFITLVTTSYNASGMFGFGKYIFEGSPNQRSQYVPYNNFESQTKPMPDGLFGLGKSFSHNPHQPTPTIPTNDTTQVSRPKPPKQKTRIVLTSTK